MSKKDYKSINTRDFCVLIPIVILLIIQLPHLSLPYFWDEAWSYMVAIRKMAEAGPSLLPGTLSMDDCKGHPQLFYFLSASWFEIFPGNISAMRLFPLLISISLLIIFYFGVRKISDTANAGMGVVVLGVQSMFLAQSIMVLPEMMLSVLLLLAFFAFIQSKYAMYALWCSFMVLTKETSLIFAAGFVLCYLIFALGKSKTEIFNWKKFMLIASPLLVYSIFIVLHKLAFGIFFYQEHLGYISFNWNTIFKKFGSAFVVIFVHYGRVFVLLSIIGITLYLLWRKIGIKNDKALICLLILFFAYLFFISINFYSPRYTLSLLVLAVLLFTLLMSSAPFHRFIKWTISIAISAVCLFYSLANKREIDIDLGYVEVIEVNQEIVKYCEANEFYNQPIAASFNVDICLKDKNLGYLSGKRLFTNVEGLDHYTNARYIIYETTTGDNPAIDWVKNHCTLKQSFVNDHAYGFIYENPSFTLQKK